LKGTHTPVLLDAIVNNLIDTDDRLAVDVTLGGGGHAYHLLERYRDLKIIGLDADRDALRMAGERLSQFGDRVILKQGNFRDLKAILTEEGIRSVDAILFDLGISMYQIEGERGFSFQDEADLDMRMDRNQKLTAFDVVNRYDYTRLKTIIEEYGEEYAAERITRAILEARKNGSLETAKDLARVVEKVKKRSGRIHPATKTFQAIRIEVNRELESLREGLSAAVEMLGTGGRVGVISFHSLEDRIVKQFFQASPDVRILTKKALQPDREEQRRNRRSRSAKLRIAQKIDRIEQ
jgi:16S rRNA (cytosine1402-N4)-methyltransferase